MPSLDIATLAILSVVTDLILVLVLLHARLCRKTYPGFNAWLAGTACWSLWSALVLVFRPLLPEFVPVVIGNALIMLHPLLLYEGIIRFYEVPQRWFRTPLNGLVVLAGVLLQLFFLYGVDDITVRGANVNIVVGLLLLRIVLEPLAIPAARRQVMQWLLSLSLLPLVCLLLYRAFILLTDVHPPVFYQDTLLRLSLFYGFFTEIIMAYTYLSLTSDRVERELLNSEERFRNLAENSADVVWQLDNNLCYCYVNEADQLLRGFHREEVIGRPVTDFMMPTDAEQVILANRERLLMERQEVKTGARRYEVQQAHKNGNYIWTEVHASPLRDRQGAITGYIGITRDITANKQHERRQAELLASEQRAREEQERFLSMISHEYRTPLAIIQSNIEILRMKQANMAGHMETNLAKMQRAVNRLVEILETGRRKGRSATGVQELALEPVAIAQFLGDIRDEAVDYWGSSRLLFTNTVDNDSVMQADAQLLRIALLNLLDNGSKYSSPTAVVEFESHRDQQAVEYIVRNRSQRSINAEPETLFRKYTRGSNSTDIAGTGEGLWLAQQIVQLHGGSIGIAIADFHTVTVTVRLPINQTNEVDHVS